MKVLVLVILAFGSVSTKGSGPYLPSGWRPDGPAFYLPTKQTPAENPRKDLILQSFEVSGSDALREYGAPKLQLSQELIKQNLPNEITEHTFVKQQVVTSDNVAEHVGVLVETLTNAQDVETTTLEANVPILAEATTESQYENNAAILESDVTQTTIPDLQETTISVLTEDSDTSDSIQSLSKLGNNELATASNVGLNIQYIQQVEIANVVKEFDQNTEHIAKNVDKAVEQVTESVEKYREQVVQNAEQSVEQISHVVEQSFGQVTQNFEYSVGQIAQNLEKSVETVAKQVEEYKQDIEQKVENAEKTVQQKLQNVENSIQNIPEIFSYVSYDNTQQVDNSSAQDAVSSFHEAAGILEQAPEGFLEYGPPGFREYGPPKEADLAIAPVEALTSEAESFQNTNEVRRRRFSPKFGSAKTI